MVVGSVSDKFINIHKNGSSDVVMVCAYVEVLMVLIGVHSRCC